jgi:GTP-binding protein
MFTFKGLKKEEINEAEVGDIIAITGFSDNKIGDTLTSIDKPEGLPHLDISDPTMKIQISVSTSPLVGQDGEFTTSRQISNRLKKEIETNVSLKIEPGETSESFMVSGGENYIYQSLLKLCVARVLNYLLADLK